MAVAFTLGAQEGNARIGSLSVKHGVIRTPAFMPVGTRGTIKAMFPEMVRETGADILLGNTYHLMLRPTAERIHHLGGLHQFMNWPHPILTDSGGYQVMSLSRLRQLNEEGVTFQSHIDGQKILLTPERSIEIQRLLGSDITMVFDECTPFPATEAVAAESMQLSMRWAQRSKAAFKERPGYGLFGIVQGGVYPDLRQESIDALLTIGFDGYAIGGLAVGEGQELMFKMLDCIIPNLPIDKPRYLMGVGKPDDIVGAVVKGVDMFDCVIPTRSGRNGQAFTKNGPINIRNAHYAEDNTAIEEHCLCYTCSNYSKAYIHHLVKIGEMLGAMLMTTHNLYFYQSLMQQLRDAIAEHRITAFAKSFLTSYNSRAERHKVL